MNKRINDLVKALTMVLMGFSLTGCFKASSTTPSEVAAAASATPTATPTPSPVPGSSADMVGHSFANPCADAGAGTSTKTSINFVNGSQGIYIKHYYSDSQCTDADESYEIYVSLAINTIGAIDPNTGRIELDYTPGNTLINPLTQSAADLFNQQSVNDGPRGYCGYNIDGVAQWAVGAFASVQGLVDNFGGNCASLEFWPSGVEAYTSVWLNGTDGTLQLNVDATIDQGNHTGCGSTNDTVGNVCLSKGLLAADVFTEQ